MIVDPYQAHSTFCDPAVNKKANSLVQVVSKQTDYHRHQNKQGQSVEGDCRAWGLGVKVTNYQDKDELLGLALKQNSGKDLQLT